METAVEKLVDSVLADAPAPLREACDRAGIIAGLDSVGAYSVSVLRSLLEQDYAGVKAAIGPAVKAAYVASLKEAVLKATATAPAAPCHTSRRSIPDAFGCIACSGQPLFAKQLSTRDSQGRCEAASLRARDHCLQIDDVRGSSRTGNLGRE